MAKLLIVVSSIGIAIFGIALYSVLFPYFHDVDEAAKELNPQMLWGSNSGSEVVPFEVPDWELSGQLPNPADFMLREEALMDFDTGINITTLRQLVNYWKNDFKFETALGRLNRHPQWLATVQGLRIHYYHIQGTSANKAIVLLHGWPGSVVEFLDFMDELHKQRTSATGVTPC